MKSKHITNVILLVFIFSACNRQSKKLDNNELSNKILVILDSVPDTRVFVTPTGGEFHNKIHCQYITDDFEDYSYFYPEDSMKCDTIEIQTIRESIILRVSFIGGISSTDFSLKKGNTYHIGYTNTIPYVKNNADYKYINNYYQNLYRMVYQDKISNLKRIDIIGLFAFVRGKNWIPTQEEIDMAVPSILLKTKKEILWQESYLDSLYSLGVLNEKDHMLYMNEVCLKKYLFNYNLTNNKFLDAFSDSVNCKWDDIIPDISDSSSYFDYNVLEFMRKFHNMGKIFSNHESLSVSRVSELLQPLNYDQRFMKVLTSKFLSTIYAEAPWNTIEKNRREYLNLYPDSKLPDFLMIKYNIDTTNVNDLKLVDPNGKETTLTNVLRELHGQNVVLDVWASWCAPCIEQIKSDKTEREKAQKEGVAHVFITFHDEKSEWLKRINEIGLENEKNSYFTTNSQTSKWFSEMKINSIPAVIFYDKTGAVVNVKK